MSSSERYLKKVTKIIYDSKKRASVSKELEDMIEDFMEAYMQRGLSEEEAKEEAIRQMGNPEETGLLFNKIYRVKYDWKMICYMLLWAVVTRGLIGILGFSDALGWPVYVWWFATIIFLSIGLLLSVLEKLYDLPFIYAWAENWKGMGISNSGMVLGCAIGCMPVSLQDSFFAFALCTAFMILQRSYMVEKRNQKEQKYLWETVTALETFDYKGRVQIGDKVKKVQIKRGEKAEKGEPLVIVGLDGFQIIVDKM